MSNKDIIHDIFATWKHVMNRPRAQLDEKRSKSISGRLEEGYTEQDLVEAIWGCASSAFHAGQNDRKKTYREITLICRDAYHVDWFMEMRAHDLAKLRQSQERQEALERARTSPVESAPNVVSQDRMQELRAMVGSLARSKGI